MSHSSRNGVDPARRTPAHSAPPLDFRNALRAELAMAWTWAAAPFKRLFESVIREGIPPPTAVQGLPPGQFPPIDAIKDELFGRTAPHRSTAATFEGDSVPGMRIPPRNDHGAR